MNRTVIIPTAGLGQRMTPYSKNINKALMPYLGKPILSHILEKFDQDTTFVVPIGYLSDQIKNYLKLVHTNKNFIFVDIDDYQSNQSGTAYTLKKCKPFVNSNFWYIPCDAYFAENLPNIDSDIYFIKKVSKNLTKHYTTFEIHKNKIQSINFKKIKDKESYAFTGIMHVKNYESFFNRLENCASVEFVDSIPADSDVLNLNSWIDLGTLEFYQNAVSQTQKFDFTKTNEFTYIDNNKVIKWDADKNKLEKKFIRSKIGPFPSCEKNHDFLCYQFVKGSTLYKNYNKEIFKKLLLWLDKELWKKVDNDISIASKKFYKDKSYDRIRLIKLKYSNLDNIKLINNKPVKNLDFYLQKINWKLLYNQSISVVFHGDLQFDNIIMTVDEKFILIDWRSDFADIVESGDLYYDIAKLYCGIILNYHLIKENIFEYTEFKDSVNFNFPSINEIDSYKKILIQYCKEKNLVVEKIKILCPLIFLNMSPLHSYPFDKMLYFLSLQFLSELYE